MCLTLLLLLGVCSLLLLYNVSLKDVCSLLRYVTKVLVTTSSCLFKATHRYIKRALRLRIHMAHVF